MFKRILVGLDGSDHARRALEIAIDLAKAHGGSLVLVRVVDHGPLSEGERKLAQTEYGLSDVASRTHDIPPFASESVPSPPLPAARILSSDAALAVRAEIARAQLQDSQQDALAKGVKSVEMRLGTGDAAKFILDAAKSEKADLIAIGSRGQSDFQGLIFGSTSHKVTHLASCSCLTVS